ncbi:MAG: hypothetical protein HY398_00465 [Candidatus Doudnabacteria bacterium]|nr:hypothetical protein [Candidatus Doudnabacteria bacterium]
MDNNHYWGRELLGVLALEEPELDLLIHQAARLKNTSPRWRCDMVREVVLAVIPRHAARPDKFFEKEREAFLQEVQQRNTLGCAVKHKFGLDEHFHVLYFLLAKLAGAGQHLRLCAKMIEPGLQYSWVEIVGDFEVLHGGRSEKHDLRIIDFTREFFSDHENPYRIDQRRYEDGETVAGF